MVASALVASAYMVMLLLNILQCLKTYKHKKHLSKHKRHLSKYEKHISDLDTQNVQGIHSSYGLAII